MFTRASASSRRGAMYCGVPITVPLVVSTWVSVSSTDVDLDEETAFRQSEIEHLHAVARQHDVLRLDVAMGDSGAMGAVERIGDLRRV